MTQEKEVRIMSAQTNNKTEDNQIKTFIPFIFVSIIVVGAGPWLLLPALKGQPLESIQSAMLGYCQLFFFAPAGIVLAVVGLLSVVSRHKTNV